MTNWRPVTVVVAAVLCAGILPLIGQTRNKPASRQTPKIYTLTPLFARIAFVLRQEICDLSSDSTKPIIETDYESDPFTIRQNIISREMDRIEEFDLRTEGDRRLFEMLRTALTFQVHDSVLRMHGIFLSGRTFKCLGDIENAIHERRVSAERNCSFGEAVQKDVDQENAAVNDAVGVERRAQAEHLKQMQDQIKRVDDENKRLDDEIAKGRKQLLEHYQKLANPSQGAASHNAPKCDTSAPCVK